MPLNGRFIVCLALFFILVRCHSKKEISRKPRQIFALLGYLHGYNIGQTLPVQYPNVLLAPVFILPTVIQQQSTSVQNYAIDENYEEENITKSNAPVKLISDSTDVNKDSTTIDDIDEFRQTLKRETVESGSNEVLNQNDDALLKQENNQSSITSVLSNLQENITTIINSTEIYQTEKTEATTHTNSEISNGPYPTAIYNHEQINSILLTTPSFESESNNLPPVADIRWQNFTINVNSSNKQNYTKIEKVTEHQISNTVSTLNKYPAALYNNAMIDQISITTNSYTNEESPRPSPQDDRWHTFSSLGKISEGFRPLAGLYYDGYLHNPINKYKIIPYPNYV